MIDKTFQIDIHAPIDRVWAELFRKGIPHHAMFGTYLHGNLEPGETITYRNKSGSHTFVLGKVLEVDPPKRLVHTFRFSCGKDEPTLVEWKLEPRGESTRVIVNHSRFEGETKTYKSVATSWPAILALYKTIIETGKPPVGARIKNGLMMAMTFMMPKAARTDEALKCNLDMKQ
jgi:uncharacterized protein YndB with AHSA1/START domain